MVPVGELPRHMMLQAERYLTARVVPGSRIIATGIYSTFAPQSKNVSQQRVAKELTVTEEQQWCTRSPPALPSSSGHRAGHFVGIVARFARLHS